MAQRDKYHNYDEFSMDENTFNVSPLKLDNELYKEELNIKYPLFGVKRKKSGWELSRDGVVVFKLADVDLTKDQIDFYKSVDGSKKLLALAKSNEDITLEKILK